MRIINRAIGVAIAISFVLLAFTGCSGMGNDNMRDDRVGTPQGLQPDKNDVTQGRMLDNDVNDGDLMDGNEARQGRAGVGMNTTRQRAMRIESACEKIPGVEDAEVIVNGETAIIGCRTNQDIKVLRQRIESRVKQLEPSVRNISITNERDILMEIRKLSKEITDGPDANNLDPRIRQLLDKITPNQ